MKQIFLSITLTIGLGCIGQPALAQATATQKAEARLAELLAPGGKSTAPSAQSGPVQWKASRGLEDFSLPITPYIGVPVRLPDAARKAVKPGAVPEVQPLVWYWEAQEVPKAVELPAKPLIRLPSVNVDIPVPIPILAQPQKDRAAVTDPTLDASVAAALLPVSAARTQPVPFTPLNLPDPFEYFRSGQLRNPPEENPMPPVILPHSPVK